MKIYLKKELRRVASRMIPRRGPRLASGLLASCLLALLAPAADASAEDRTLKLYFGHTGERAVITFKRNGVFDQAGLTQLNQFLRDWRADKSIKMDPRLFDIVWDVYRRSGATDYINVVSGYRSPNTNAMLRTRSAGVAKESQHTQGRAMDFFIPGVKLATLRALAMQEQGGGVGFYPTSGSPFVHVDVGGVRAWPRMSRQELVQLFPNGKTLHIPSDGKPLPGYQTAVAEYKRKGAGPAVEIASFGGTKRKGFFETLFGGNDSEEEDDVAETTVAAASRRTPQPAKAAETVGVASAEPAEKFTAPIPARRPEGTTLLTALRPTAPAEHEAFAAVTSTAAAGKVEEPASFEDLSGYAIPVPAFASRPAKAEKVITASTSVPTQTVQASVASAALPRRELASALAAPSETSPVAKTSFSASYTTGYPAQKDSRPVATAASFDFGRFGDAP